jgi:hypothetical protein
MDGPCRDTGHVLAQAIRHRDADSPREGSVTQRHFEVGTCCATGMRNFSGPKLLVFSMHDLDSGRTPMWKIGHTKLGDHWIPVALPPPSSSSVVWRRTGGQSGELALPIPLADGDAFGSFAPLPAVHHIRSRI